MDNLIWGAKNAILGETNFCFSFVMKGGGAVWKFSLTFSEHLVFEGPGGEYRNFLDTAV